MELAFPEELGNIGVVFVFNTFYGAFFIFFILSALVLHHQSAENKRRSSGSFGTTVYLTLGYVLFALITTDWILMWIMFSHPEVGTSVKMFDNDQTSIFSFVQSTVVGNLAIFVADIILMYRLYIIWDWSRAVLWVCGIMSIAEVVLLIPILVYFVKHGRNWKTGIVIWSTINLMITVVTTALIAYKLWLKGRITRSLGGQQIIIKIIAILIESAALHTLCMIVFMILYLTKFDASHLISQSLPTTAGIATALVNVRVGLGWAAGEEGRSVNVHTLTRQSSLNASEFSPSRRPSFEE